MKREISDGSVDLNSSVIFLDVKKTCQHDLIIQILDEKMICNDSGVFR